MAANRCPDKYAGLTIICRRCKTQINVPESSHGAGTRPWFTSPGWLAVALVELLAAAGFVVSLVVLLTASGPAAPSGDGAAPTLASVGKTLLVEWHPSLTTPGGYFKITKPSVALELSGRPAVAVAAQVEDNPWPTLLVGDTDGLPDRTVKHLRLHVDIPSANGLRGRRATLRVDAELEHLYQPKPGAALVVRTQEVHHEQALFLADSADLASMDRQKRLRGVLRYVVFGCALIILAVGIGAYVFGQKRVTIMCPKCGRAAPVLYYHERGECKISPCPHSNTAPTADYG